MSDATFHKTEILNTFPTLRKPTMPTDYFTGLHNYSLTYSKKKKTVGFN